MKRDSAAYGAARPAYDKNDCVVRAVAIVTGCAYEQASAILSAAGRQLRKGTEIDVSRRVNEDWLKMRPMPDTISWPVAAFIAAHPKGRYLVYRKGHAFAVVDGVLHDWERGTTARTTITHCWECTEETLAKMEQAKALFT